MRCLALHLIVVSIAAVAAEPDNAPDVRVVTLDEVLHAVEAVPDVVAARANERAVSARLKLAKTPGEPVLSLETRSITARESVALAVPFRWGGQRSAAVGAAKADNEAAARSRELALATARRAVTAAWYTLAASEQRMAAATGQAARAERNRQAVADLVAVERGSKLDAARATTEAATAAAAFASAEQEAIAASAELAALLGANVVRLS